MGYSRRIKKHGGNIIIFIQDSNRDAINNYLKLAGLRCNYLAVRNFAWECEQDFSKNSIKEQNRVKAGCSKIWTDEKGAYEFTIKRMMGGYWALIQAKGEQFKVPSGSLLLSPVDRESIIGAIQKTASEISSSL